MGAALSSQGYDGQSQLGAKLASKQPLLVAFMSPQCGLCASLRPALTEVTRQVGARGRAPLAWRLWV